jgi:hypothetical protein
MGILSLTAMASYSGDNLSGLIINVSWFKYIGQDVCFLFIALSLATTRDRDLRSLIRWELLFFVLLLILLTPLLPASFPYPSVTRTILGGLRFLLCLIIFFFYLATFMKEETRFSLLMSCAFFLMSVGYILNVPRYLDSHFILLDVVGDIVRMCGILLLLIAMFAS